MPTATKEIDQGQPLKAYNRTFDLGKGKGSGLVRIVFGPKGPSSRIQSTQPFYPGNNSGEQTGFGIDVNEAKTNYSYPYSAAMFGVTKSSERLATVFFTNKEAFVKLRSLIFFHSKRMAYPNPEKPPARSEY